MTTTFNLADQPWIGVLTTTGTTRLSLTDVFTHADTIRCLATGSPLADAASNQLLLAIWIAAAGNPAQWVGDHRDHLDLFHPEHPFGQYAPLRDHPNDSIDITSMFAEFNAAEASFSNYDSLVRPGKNITLHPADAALLLLVRQHYSVGGLIGGLGAKLGGSKSAKVTPGVNHPHLHPDLGTLAANLTAQADTIAAHGAPAGHLHLGLPADRPLARPVDNPGVLDVLTYQSRAMLLTPDDTGNIARAHYVEGDRLEVGDLSPELWPTTTWSETKPGVWQPRKSHLSRPAWQQLLDAYTESQPSLLAPGALPPATPLTMTTLSAFQSRIDGVFHDRTIIPAITVDEVAELADQVATVRKQVYAAGGALASNLASGDASNRADAYANTIRDDITDRVGDIVHHRLAGHTSPADVLDGFRSVVRDVQHTNVAGCIATHPTVAVATATRYARQERTPQ